MKIQNVNYIAFGKFGFKNKENNAERNQILNCGIQEYSDGRKRMISFSFDKDDLFKLFKNLMKKTSIFANKDDKNNIQININSEESTKIEKYKLEESGFATDMQTPDFPTPKFKSNPTIEQRDEYIKDVFDFFKSALNTDDKLKALKEIEKYGISDIDPIMTVLLDEDEKVVREALKVYQKFGTDKDAYNIIFLITGDEINIKENETFAELLKTTEKLAKLENDSEQDRKIVLEPIRRLLNHENENIKKMAQETLDKITPKK